MPDDEPQAQEPTVDSKKHAAAAARTPVAHASPPPGKAVIADADPDWQLDPKSICLAGNGCIHLVNKTIDGCDLGILLFAAEKLGDYDARFLAGCTQYVEREAAVINPDENGG